jgi:hypothetical protein
MDFINIIFIILTIIIFIIIIYLFIFLPNQLNKKVVDPISPNINEIKPTKIDFNKDDFDKYKYPDLVPNKDNKNIPIDINPNACKNMVMDYDEINLNSVKSDAEKLDIDISKHTEQKLIKMDKDNKPLELTKVTTFMGLPGYKPYNIQDTNNYELKENNNGSTNYIKLKDTESFKPCNSLINTK